LIDARNDIEWIKFNLEANLYATPLQR
jgi:hypothetical protein